MSFSAYRKVFIIANAAAAISFGLATSASAGSSVPVAVPEVSTAGALAAFIVVVGLALLVYERRKTRD